MTLGSAPGTCPAHSDLALTFKDYVPAGDTLLAEAHLDAAGGHVDIGYALDWDLLLRFRYVGARMVRLPRYLGAFRVHHGQKATTLHALAVRGPRCPARPWRQLLARQCAPAVDALSVADTCSSIRAIDWSISYRFAASTFGLAQAERGSMLQLRTDIADLVQDALARQWRARMRPLIAEVPSALRRQRWWLV